MISRQYNRQHLGLVLFAALGLFAYREWITQSAPIHLFFDEAYYYGWSQDLAWGYYSKPPMVAWLIRLTTDLFGPAEWAIKLAAPLLYSVSAVLIYCIGLRIHSSRAGLASALLFVTMPLVSFNSLFITTDAPLLFFWSLALWLFLIAQQRNDWQWWLLAGVVGGLGLLSKYTFILFPAGFLLFALFAREGRELLTNPRFWVACLLAITLLAPNLWWNYQHDFISFQHTAEISKQEENSYSLIRLLEYLGAQFLVFGPIALALLLVSALKIGGDTQRKLLWAIFLPVFLVISIQALSARANINWGAPAYVSASLIVGITIAQLNLRKTLQIAVLLNLAMMLAFYHLNSIQSGLGIERTAKNNPYNRISGWYELSQQIQPVMAAYPDALIASESRKVLAYFGYYREPKNLRPRALNLDNHIKSQYELLYPLATSPAQQHLFLSENLTDQQLSRYFESAQTLVTERVQITKDMSRTIHVTLVSGYKGDQ